jgi:hypothetical protein
MKRMLNMFPFVRAGARRRARDKQEIMTRLEALAADQSEIKRYVILLMESETALVKAQDVQLERLRPSRPAWIQCSVLLALSGAAIVAGTILNNSESSLSNQASSIHQTAQTDRVEAIEQLLEDFEPLNQVNSLGASALSKLSVKNLLEIMTNEAAVTQGNVNAAENEMTTANKLDTLADQAENQASRYQLFSQITLGLSAAFFGAVLGWAITQFLAELRWRKRSMPESDVATS